MTYIYRALREGPLGLWPLDSSFDDSSGYGNDASSTGTPTETRPIVAGGIAAQRLTSGDEITYPIDTLMIAGRESRAFSLEAWVQPQSGDTTVIARDASGIFIDDQKLRFTVEMDETISAEYSNLIPGNIYHIVGIYDTNSIYLIVNGEVVASAPIPAGSFVDTDTELRSLTDGSVLLDSVAVYNYALSYYSFTSHYQAGIAYPQVINLSSFNGGKYYQFDDDSVNVHTKITVDSDEEWSSGLSDVTVMSIDNKLVNVFDEADNEYKAGTWSYLVSFEPEAVMIEGSRITWDAVGAIVVEKTVDDISYTTLNNGDPIVTSEDLTDGVNITIRISFPDSVEQTYVNYLMMAFYNSKDSRGSDESLPAEMINPANVVLSDKKYDAASFNDNSGALFGTNSGLKIEADGEFGGYYAVEMTVKFDTSTASKTIMYVDSASSQPEVATNGSGEWVGSNLTALYIDGDPVTVATNVEPDIWHHVLAVFPESEFPIFIGNDDTETAGYPMRLGHLALYSTDIDANMAEAIYLAWIGAPAIQIEETNTVNIGESTFAETGTAFRAYSFDWSITPVG